MKTFYGKYLCFGNYGTYQSYTCIVLAETADTALGIILMEYQDTEAVYWEVKELTTPYKVVRLAESGS